MPFKKTPGMNKLANVLSKRMKDEAQYSIEVPFDFGIIQSDMSLLTDTYSEPIPKGEYLLCRHLTLGAKDHILAKTQNIGKPFSGSHLHKTMKLTCSSHGGSVSGTVGEKTGAAPEPPIPSKPTAGSDSSDGMHQHHVLIPEKMRSLLPGDRVLVAWVADDAVIIDILEES